MGGLKLVLSKMNGWALSLLLHGGLAGLAALSVFSAHLGGGSGTNGNGSTGSAGTAVESYAATVRSDDRVISGTVLPDLPHYGRLMEDPPFEPIAEEDPIPSVPFDVFAVGSSEPHETLPETLSEPPSARPGSFEGRTTKLPAASEEGSEGPSGAGGSGGGDSGGNGRGDGSGDGNATGVYTPIPPYPNEARRRNIEGSVRVELAIAADGSCEIRRVIESSGFSPLDHAVQETVKKWKYLPAEEDGRPEVITKLVRFTFKLGR